MRRSFLARLALAAVLSFSASAALAHDFFLIPVQFEAGATSELRIEATVGSSFPQRDNAITADRLARLHARGPGSPELIVAGPGQNALNLTLRLSQPGLHVAGVATVPRDVDYAEDRIGLIIEEYHLGAEAAAFVERLPRPRTWQVSSRRYAKTIVCAQSCTGDAAAQRFGFDLEFVSAGADEFQLIGAEGRPLGNHLVQLVGSDAQRRQLRTDADGRVRLPEGTAGTFMLFAAALRQPSAGQRSILDLSSLTLAR